MKMNYKIVIMDLKINFFEDKFFERKHAKEMNRVKFLEKKNHINSTNKVKSKTFYQKNRITTKQEKYKEKNINRSLRYYNDISEKVPSFIRRNLKNMPNNRGYIWKSIWFFGEKLDNPINNTLVMHEIFRNKTLIHTIKNKKKTTITKYKQKRF